jgi:hypothetical protein
MGQECDKVWLLTGRCDMRFLGEEYILLKDSATEADGNS